MTSIQSFFNSIMSDQTTALIAFGVAVLVALLDLIATWRVYTKAGQGGWKCLIPLYNSYTLYRISWRAGMFWLVFFLTFIGWALFDAEVLATTFTQIASYVTILQIVGAAMILIASAISVVQVFKLSQAYGHGAPFAVGLIFLTPLFILILGFGRSRYEGPLA